MAKITLFFGLVALFCCVNAQQFMPHNNPAMNQVMALMRGMNPHGATLLTNSLSPEAIRSLKGGSGQYMSSTSYVDKNGQVQNKHKFIANTNQRVHEFEW